MLSIIYLLLLPRHSLPSLSAHVISLLSSFHSHTHHFLISTPFIPFCLTTFSLDIFYSLPSNYTNQIACIQHIICRPFASNLLPIYCRPFSHIQFISIPIDFINVACWTQPSIHFTISTFIRPHFLFSL